MLCVESSLEPNEEITAITTITIIIQNHHFLYIGFFFFLGGDLIVNYSDTGVTLTGDCNLVYKGEIEY